jgi:hypothetical protein
MEISTPVRSALEGSNLICFFGRRQKIRFSTVVALRHMLFLVPAGTKMPGTAMRSDLDKFAQTAAYSFLSLGMYIETAERAIKLERKRFRHLTREDRKALLEEPFAELRLSVSLEESSTVRRSSRT